MFSSFKQRNRLTEMMDDASIGDADFGACLHDLASVNTLSLGYRPTLDFVKEELLRAPDNQELSLIDVGSGGGDTLREIRKFLKGRRHVTLLGVDLNPWAKAYADKATAKDDAIIFETSDIFRFDPQRQADFIISSLFTHHLTDEEVVQFLSWMETHARRGWFINDIHRHPIPYFFVKYLSKLFHFHIMVQHDGPVSVKRAFSRKDWADLLAKAGIPKDHMRIRWYFPFRYCVMRQKP